MMISRLRPKPLWFEILDMKRMKAIVECTFEFPDDYSIAPDHDGIPNLKIGKTIFVPAIHWMEQTVFLEPLIPGQFETEPSRGFQPADKETNDEIMSHRTMEGGHVEMAGKESAD
jgi:hypothetical protein